MQAPASSSADFPKLRIAPLRVDAPDTDWAALLTLLNTSYRYEFSGRR